MAAQDTGAREAPQHDRSLSARLRTRFGGRSGEPQRQPWRVEGAGIAPRGSRAPTGRADEAAGRGSGGCGSRCWP